MKTILKIDGRDRVMVLAPHPDDETLAVGGLLQRAAAEGAAVRVIFLTDGENNPWPQRARELRWKIGPAERERWGKCRNAEVAAAFSVLGLPADAAEFLHLPDQGLTDLLMSGRMDAVSRLEKEIENWGPTLLVTPSERDGHPDHSASAVLAAFAARADSLQSPLRRIRYVIHRPRPGTPDRKETHYELSAAQKELKRDAILRYGSQMLLSRRRFLAYAGDRERFEPADETAGEDAGHPVRAAVLQNGALRIQWASRHRPVFTRRVALKIAGEDPLRNPIRLVIPIPRRASGHADVIDGVSGETVARVRIHGDRRSGEIVLASRFLRESEKMFVKLENRTGFFDSAGWREVPVPGHPETPAGDAVGAGHARRPPVVCCVVPCYNIAGLCGEVVREAASYADFVIAVDDGSSDGTGAVLRRVSAGSGGRVRVVSFPANRGKGRSLLEAFRAACRDIPFDLLVTMDGDGQHRPADIPRLVRAWEEEGASLVIGERVQFGAMPLRSRIGNTLTGALLRSLHSESPLDTQSGLRGLDRNFVMEVLRSVDGSRYETEMKILLLALTRRRRIGLVPIQTVYLDGNRSSHFRPIRDSLRIYWTLIHWRQNDPVGEPCSENPR
jgi:LmbE family N-acetylglucosaminyl deacetylase